MSSEAKKKLRQQYMKARDAMRKSGASTNEKDKCPFYDDLDNILGTRPTSTPIRVIESSPASDGSVSADVASPSPTENTNEIGK